MIEEITAGVASHHIAKMTDSEDANSRLTQDILDAIQRFHAYVVTHTPPPECSDIFRVQTLYKIGQGPPLIPSPEGRQFMRILVTQATAINVNSILGPPFVLTVPVPTPPYLWMAWDWPDQTVFTLDATATANAMPVYIRYTNDKP